MVALTYVFRGTVYHRAPTCGGMDSEPAGSTVEGQVMTIVVPSDNQQWRDNAVSYIRYYGGNWRDPAFEFMNNAEPTATLVIHAVISAAQTRLD